MTDRRSFDPADGELLSAYLAGDLDAEAVATLEARLAADPDLARRLDTTARLLVSLRGVDEPDLPPGAGERLRQRLAAEAGTAAAQGTTSETTATSEATATAQATGRPAGGPTGEAPAPVTALDSRRRRAPWPAVAGIAAGLVAVALVGGGLLQGLGDRGTDIAADSPEADMRLFSEDHDDAAGQAPALEQDGAHEETALERAPATTGEAQPAPAPVVADENVALDGVTAVRERYAEVAQTTGLLGESLPAARERAADYRAAIAAAPAFASGHDPGACLDADGVGADPAIPVLVESAVLDGEPAVVYVLVSANAGATELNRVEVQVLTLPDCTTRLSVDLS